MCDIFLTRDIQNLMTKRLIWFCGDSNIRALYKDFISLCQRNNFVPPRGFRTKLEKSFMNDKLIRGDVLHNGRQYEEERVYFDKSMKIKAEFMFLTKCLTERLREKIESIKVEEDSPDLIVINSCLWDICRWGPDGVKSYKKNIVELMKLLKKYLFPRTLVIWVTTPPLAAVIHGSLLINQIEFMKHSARFEVMEGNLFVRQEVIAHGFDVLDLHYHLLLQIHRRCADGIHWPPETVRHCTNLILTHTCISWGKLLPGNFRSKIVEKEKNKVYNRDITDPGSTLQQLQNVANTASKVPNIQKQQKRKKRRSNRHRPYYRP